MVHCPSPAQAPARLAQPFVPSTTGSAIKRRFVLFDWNMRQRRERKSATPLRGLRRVGQCFAPGPLGHEAVEMGWHSVAIATGGTCRIYRKGHPPPCAGRPEHNALISVLSAVPSDGATSTGAEPSRSRVSAPAFDRGHPGAHHFSGGGGPGRRYTPRFASGLARCSTGAVSLLGVAPLEARSWFKERQAGSVSLPSRDTTTVLAYWSPWPIYRYKPHPGRHGSAAGLVVRPGRSDTAMEVHGLVT